MTGLVRSFYGVVVDELATERLREDCKTSFNCRSLSSGSENYSTGSTYFIKANDKPGCNLEALALQIFQQHTSGLDYDAKNSGAEWWSQSIDHRDDIGFHWDRDYGAEEERGEHIYPKFATVTYVSKEGGPTVVMDKAGTDSSDEPLIGSVQRFAASRPLVGKHIAFDGSLLHAAPSDFGVESEGSDNGSGPGSEESEDDSDEGPLRVTFLVNVWVNHIPSQSQRLPNKDQKTLSPIDSSVTLQFNNTTATACKEVPLTRKDCVRYRSWEFNNTGVNYDVKVPLPSLEDTEQLLSQHDNLVFTYVSDQKSSASNKASYDGHGIEILFSAHQPSDAEDDSENGEGEENSEGEEDIEESEAESEEEEAAEEAKPAKKRRY
jgi:hypothetical protein